MTSAIFKSRRYFARYLILLAIAASLAQLGRSQDEPIVAVQDGKYGYIDHTGKIVIPSQFLWAEDFWKGLGTVYVCGQYLSIDSSGVLHPLRIAIQDHVEPRRDGKKVGFVGDDGRFKISPTFDDALPFSDGLAAVQRDGKWGFIDAAGHLVIPLQFTAAFYFREGVGTAESDASYVLIDKIGKVLASGFQSVDLISDGRIPVTLKEKTGYLDLQGKVAIPIVYEAGRRFSQGLVAVKKEGKWGYLDTSGKLVIPFKFDEAGEFASGLAPVKVGGRTGFINKSGEFSFDLPFQYAPGFFEGDKDNNLFIAESDVSRFWTSDNRFGYVNTSGRVIWGPTEESPNHPPLSGWSTEANLASCKGISEAMKVDVQRYSPR
jgi:hypothetical protein